MMNLFYYDGGLASCRSILEEAGAVEVSFSPNTDIFPYLRRNNFCLYIDEGFLDSRLLTAGMDIYEPITYTSGSMLIGGLYFRQEPSLGHCALIPAIRPLHGLVLPRETLLEQCGSNREIWTALFRSFKEISYIHSMNTVLFHMGSGINRVCNYLWIYDMLRMEHSGIPYITQDKIMYKTLLSKSQVTRVLGRLREARVIDTHYREIVILDRKKMERFLSPFCANAQLNFSK